MRRVALRLRPVLLLLAVAVALGAWPASIGAETRPAARGYHGLAYDAESDRVILLGGATSPGRPNLADTWAYLVGGNAWTEMASSPSPPAEGQDMVYLARSDRVILVQGNPPQIGRLEHVWEYDFNSNAWTLRQAANAPVWRNGFRTVYDKQSDRIILFGGCRSLCFNDTWAYDPGNTTWTQMSPKVSPSGRNWHRMVYDAKRDRIVLFGGDGADNGVWAYDYDTDTWESLGAVGAPGPRSYHDMVYDGRVERIVLFGGADVPSENPNNDTWEYDLGANTWTKLAPKASPSPRGWHAMAYSSRPDRIVLFGGGPDRNHYTRETWVLDLGNNTWTLADAPAPPVAHFTFSPASPTAGALVTFNATGSSDPDGSIVSLVWNFGDGGAALGAAVAHAYAAAGAYTVILTATDNDGLRNTSSSQIVVGPAPDTTNPSVAITSPANGATVTTTPVTVSGTASDDVAVSKVELSLDGTTWVLAAGTTSWSGSLTLVEGPNTIHARATDTSGNVARTSVSVTVQPPAPPPPPPPGADLVLLVVAVALITGAAVAGVVILRRRREGRR